MLDRYHVQLVAQAGPFAEADFSLYSFFSTKEELVDALVAFGSRVTGAIEGVLRIFEGEEKIEEHRLLLAGRKSTSLDDEHIDLTSHKEVLFWVQKHLDLQDKKVMWGSYCSELVLQREQARDSVILTHFRTICEWEKILSWLGKQIGEDGIFSFFIDYRQGMSNRICSKAYKMFADGSLLVPEASSHYVQMKKPGDVKQFALTIWEDVCSNHSTAYSQSL